jgi:cystathionine beta-lyase/cystathionine gamma-synthase
VSATAAATRADDAADEPLVAAALADLAADFDELLFLARSAAAELAAADDELARASLRLRTRERLRREVERARRRYRAVAEHLLALHAQATAMPASRSVLDELATEKASLADLLRVEQALTAALLGAGDWQSPSFLHSLTASAGRQEGRIRPHWNDYKRDRHLDAERYERRYLRALVDGSRGLRALLTSCGMAAFTTVLSFLQLEGKLDGPVLAGMGLYHENRLLLERVLPGRLQLVDEADRDSLLHAIDELRPSALFLDSLSNTKWMPIPDLAPLLEHVAGTQTYVVVDNTGLSVSCQPFALADESVRLIVVESLLKYAQLGLDRANAGVIIARGDDGERLSGYREHLGTNVADVAVHALPRPDRRLLARRLARLQRNALLLAEGLHAEAASFVEVVHPGLPSHRCAAVAHRLSFRGGCVSLVLHEADASLRRERALIVQAVAEAARRGVGLLGGSSFGFDTTRIYLTAEGADYGEPFVRVAAGTEHRLDVERVADVLVAAVCEVGA